MVINIVSICRHKVLGEEWIRQYKYSDYQLYSSDSGIWSILDDIQVPRTWDGEFVFPRFHILDVHI